MVVMVVVMVLMVNKGYCSLVVVVVRTVVMVTIQIVEGLTYSSLFLVGVMVVLVVVVGF